MFKNICKVSSYNFSNAEIVLKAFSLNRHLGNSKSEIPDACFFCGMGDISTVGGEVMSNEGKEGCGRCGCDCGCRNG